MKKFIKIMLWITFIIYCIAIIFFLFINRRHNVYDVTLLEYIMNSVNLIPFKTVAEYISKINSGTMNSNIIAYNLLGNLLVFLPMGFFIPAIFKKLRSVKKCIPLILLLIVLVETLQLIFKVGIFDIDDIILNIFSVFIGFGIWKIAQKAFNRKTKKN